MLPRVAASAAACLRTAGNCLRLALRVNGEERSALPGRSVAGSTEPAGLECAHTKGVLSPLVGVAAPFSQAAGEGSEVR